MKLVIACLEHVFVLSNNQVETCCILTKRSANRGDPSCTRFRRVFSVSKMDPSIGQKLNVETKPDKTLLFSKKKLEDVSCHPKPTFYLQTLLTSSRSVSDGVIH